MLSSFHSPLSAQNASIFFGDIVATSEMLQKIEFSFFTLPDSGAFLTHAPRRLSEVFALLYPFHRNVYPSLVVTIVTVGPILYLIIAAHERATAKTRPRRNFNGRESSSSPPSSFYDIIYIREMYGGSRRRVGVTEQLRHSQTSVEGCGVSKHERRSQFTDDNRKFVGRKQTTTSSSSEGLLSRCVWFTCHIFLRQC